jgi:quercetin dioxygenase-like cupin family protein
MISRRLMLTGTAGLIALATARLVRAEALTLIAARSGTMEIKRNDPVRIGAGQVTFEPGARTAWHSHPLGQTLIIASGLGWVQRESGPIEEVRPGDVVWFPPGLKHWHGATPTTAMTHIAVQESLNGKNVDWLEKVTDEQYRR